MTPTHFTDAPPLQPSLLLGSLRLTFWLFFHPTAWSHHVQQIDPQLQPDFCLAELTLAQLQKTAVWRFLLMTHLTWPFVSGGGLMIGLALAGLPPTSLILAGMISIVVGLMASLAASLTGSVAVGISSGIAVGSVVGAAGGFIFGNLGSLTAPTFNQPLDQVVSAVVGLSAGLAGGLGFGVATGLAQGRPDPGTTNSLLRRVLGVVMGLLIGIGAGLLVEGINGRFLTAFALGLPFALALTWRTQSRRRGAAGGLLLGLLAAASGGLGTPSLANGLVGLLGLLALAGALFALPYALAERIAGAWAGALAGALGSGAGFFLLLSSSLTIWPLLAFSLLGLLLGLTLAWWRPVLTYPLLALWNGLLLGLDERRVPRGQRPLFPYHSAFWDEFQRLPLWRLEDHLLLVLTHQPQLGQQALVYLSQSQQRWAAQAAQIELDARRLQACVTVTAVAQAHLQLAAGELTGPASALLRSFSRVSQDVAAALRQESAYNQRLALSAVEERLDGLLRELTRSTEPYASRFRPIAEAWRRLVAQQTQQLAEEAELRQEIDNPYIIGVPLTDQQAIFVGRTAISARIEQLLLDRRRPPLLLYGQRRVGKTSLLNNLGRLLPSSIVPLFVDLQGPAAQAEDHASFLYNLARAMRRSAQRQRSLALPNLSREALAADPFTAFDEWLDGVEMALGRASALLMLDEFEVLERVLAADGNLREEAVLGMLRHLIQHRPRFKVLLSGSHTLDAFQRWASYLINVQVIHIGYLSAAETARLIETPTADFALRYEPAARERVLELTRGHPFLVQLLCAEIVALKNEQPPAQRRLAQWADVATAVAPALDHGSFFFADIAQNQVNEAGRRLLTRLAQTGEGGVWRVEALTEAEKLTLRQLEQQELVESTAVGYRFQIELVRRWFASK